MNCSMCKHYRPPQEGQQLGTCVRNPPTAFMVPFNVQKTPQNPQGVVLGVQSYFPPVGPEWLCGSFVAQLLKAN